MGPDGRLYTVRKEEGEEPQQKSRRKSKTKNVVPSTMKPKTKTIAVSFKDNNNDDAGMVSDSSLSSSSSSSSSDDSSSSDEDEKMTTTATTTKIPVVVSSEKKKNNNNKRKRIVGVIVEDASDSEYDNDDYNSPWRNRRPSPGQWLEPVENFMA